MENKKLMIGDYEFISKTFSTYGTEGVVYYLECPCPLAYIGKTTRILRTRLRLKTKDAPLMEHFLVVGHKEEEFIHTVLHMGTSRGKDLQSELLKSEAYWIHHLGTTVFTPGAPPSSLPVTCGEVSVDA